MRKLIVLLFVLALPAVAAAADLGQQPTQLFEQTQSKGIVEELKTAIEWLTRPVVGDRADEKRQQEAQGKLQQFTEDLTDRVTKAVARQQLILQAQPKLQTSVGGSSAKAPFEVLTNDKPSFIVGADGQGNPLTAVNSDLKVTGTVATDGSITGGAVAPNQDITSDLGAAGLRYRAGYIDQIFGGAGAFTRLLTAQLGLNVIGGSLSLGPLASPTASIEARTGNITSLGAVTASGTTNLKGNVTLGLSSSNTITVNGTPTFKTAITAPTTSSTINGIVISSGAVSGVTTLNTAKISGGTLSGGTVSGGTVSGGTFSGGTHSAGTVSGGELNGGVYEASGIRSITSPYTINVNQVNVTGDISAAGGYKVAYTFQKVTTAASDSSVAIDVAGASTIGVTEFVMPYAGSILAITASLKDAVTAGTLFVKPTVNGTEQGMSANLSTTTTNNAISTAAKDTYTFSAGQRIGVKYTTSADYTPTLSNLSATVVIEF